MKKTFSLWRYLCAAILIITLSTAQMWGAQYSETHATPSANSGDFTQITVSGGVSFGNSSLQIGSNGGSGSFTIAVLDGSYIDSITFAKNGNYPVGTLDPHSGTNGAVTNRNSGEIWKFVPSTSMSSATFDMSAPSGKKTRLNNIKVYWKSDYEHFTKNFSVSGSSAPYSVGSTKSNASSDVTMTINSNSSVISSNCLQLGNGKALTITSSGHNIKKIVFLATSHGEISNLSANTGTYTSASRTWAANSAVQTATFTSSGSNATIAAICVELEDIVNYYTLSFNANGHGTAPDPIENLVSGSKPAKPEDPSEAGWIFGGWNTKADGTGEDWVWGTSAVTQDTTLYAKWTEDQSVTKYHVTYNLNGASGEAPTQADAAENAEITLAAEPSYDGHEFLGWSDGSNIYAAGDSYTMPAADVEFAAQWCTTITPTLSYNYVTVYPEFGIEILPTIEGNSGSGEVSYASSDNSVAIVDAETGEITPVAVGTVTITATIAAAAGYCGNTAEAVIKVVAAPTHLIQNNLNVTSGDWESIILTNNTAKITTLKEWQIADGQDRTAGVTDKQSIKNNRTHGIGTTAAKVDAYYMYLSFQIAEGHELTLSAVNIPVFGISAGKTTEVEIADNASHKITVNGTITQDADGNGFGTYDFSKSPKLSGIVTLKMWAYGATSGYRMKSPLYLDGTITTVQTSISNTEVEVKAVKRIENGMLVIEKDGKTYNVMGARIR